MFTSRSDYIDKGIYVPLHRKIDDAVVIATCLFMLLLVCSVFMWVTTHTIKTVTGTSMLPSVNTKGDSDIVLVSTISTPQRGDMIIYDMTNAGVSALQTKLLIKRVIAIAGDTVKLTYEDGINKIFINGTLITEDYIGNSLFSDKTNAFENQNQWVTKLDKNEDGSVTIPDGYFLFFGDNRDVSYDGRMFGPMKVDGLIGVVDTLLIKDSGIFYDFFLWLLDIYE